MDDIDELEVRREILKLQTALVTHESCKKEAERLLGLADELNTYLKDEKAYINEN